MNISGKAFTPLVFFFGTNPTLFLSSKLGTIDRIYAHVQISSRITVSRLWKLNRADYPWKRKRIKIRLK